MLLYGRTLYGGPFNPRQITAEGSAVCAASITARATAALRSASGSFATATVAHGSALRTALPRATASAARATVGTAKGVASFRPRTVAQAVAMATGRPRVSFFGAVTGAAAATPTGKIIRTIRVRIPTQARGVATPEAEGALYALASPAASLCYSNPFGTYWFVGRGESGASASVTGAGQRIRAAQGEAICTASGAGVAKAQLRGAGGALGAATPDPDSSELRGGVRHWTGRGNCAPSAAAYAGAYVFTVALAVGRAEVRGAPNAHRVARGVSATAAGAAGFAEIVLPEYGRVVIDTLAAGSAVARLAAAARAQVAAAGASVARGKVVAAAGGACNAGASVGAALAWIGISGSATASSSPRGRVARACVARAEAAPTGQAAGGARKAVAARVGVGGLAMGIGEGIYHPKVLAAGHASASCEPTGVNTVNSARQRLSTRCVRISHQPRVVVVAAQQRLLREPGPSKRLVAA